MNRTEIYDEIVIHFECLKTPRSVSRRVHMGRCFASQFQFTIRFGIRRLTADSLPFSPVKLQEAEGCIARTPL